MSTALPERPPLGPLPLLRGAREIFALTFDGLVLGRRTVLMAVLLGLPALFAVVFRLVLAARLPARISGSDLYGVIVAIYDVRNVLPLCALFFASALIAEEVEGRTLTYLLTRPVQRASILLGKFAAYVVTSLVFAWPVTVVTFLLLSTARGAQGLGAEAPVLLQDLGVMALALIAYGALFALLGVLLKRPVIGGLLFLYLWELLVYLPGYLPRLTLTAYLRSLLSHRPAEEGLAQAMGTTVFGTGESLLSLAVLTALFLVLAFGIFSRREYVMEQ